jgi:hypothetical protein
MTYDAAHLALAQRAGARVCPGGPPFTRATAQAWRAALEIMILELRNGERREGDWPQGCIALTNGEMEELWRLVEDGTAVEINP